MSKRDKINQISTAILRIVIVGMFLVCLYIVVVGKRELDKDVVKEAIKEYEQNQSRK